MGRWVTAAVLLYPIVVWGLAFRLGVPGPDAAFLAALLVSLPMLAVAQIPLVAGARIERVPAYLASAGTVATLGLLAALLGVRSLGLEGMGLGALPLRRWVAWSAGATAAAAAVVVAMHVLRRRLALAESPLLQQLIPRTRREKGVFVVLSFAAGLGEEIALRGYALPMLAPLVGGPWEAAVFTSLVFGLLHAYQGALGMARTGLVGFVLAACFLASGSLWPAIAAHVALDLLGGLVWGDRLTS